MDNETKRYIDDINERLHHKIRVEDNELRKKCNMLFVMFLTLVIMYMPLIYKVGEFERKPANQTTLSDKDVKALLDYGSRVNTMWNEREANRKNQLKIEEAVKRSLKGEIGQLPGVE